MFEDFSFSSPSSRRPRRVLVDGEDRLMVDPDSTLISPLSSRCPSPKSSQRPPQNPSRSRSAYLRSPQGPTSVPPSYDQQRLSIGTLTKKLHEHTLQNQTSEEHQGGPLSLHSAPDAGFAGCVLTPPDTDHDETVEGYFDSSSLTSASQSPTPQSPFLSPTSIPSDLMAMDGSESAGPGDHDATDVRAHRQQIVSRVQCNPTGIDAVRRALLSDEGNAEPDSFGEDDCHPSSLPPQVSPRRRAVTYNRSRFAPSGPGSPPRGRRKSTSASLPSHRIDKSHHQSHRDHHKKSEQGLRRKSLVSAALASINERAL
ncbi:hypothetical protein PHISP_02075 [Aspergillus sp. HF37]|nr:hypothetical protein PHISP_02075 [Aspergillus sp. HF37]